MIIKMYPNRMENWDCHLSFMKKDKTEFYQTDIDNLKKYNMALQTIQDKYGIKFISLDRENNKLIIQTYNIDYPIVWIIYSPNLNINIFI
jgi:hypothetical protein